MQIEDERRWLLTDGMPSTSTLELVRSEGFEHITQFYTPTTTGSQRFRKAVGTKGNHYTQTIKGPKNFSAGAEWEVDTEQWVYDLMQNSSIGSVEKGRTTLWIENYLYELDEFMGNCAGLVIVELEFRIPPNTEADVVKALHDEYRKCGLPGVFGENREITGDSSYSNYSLALDGIPEVVYDH